MELFTCHECDTVVSGAPVLSETPGELTGRAYTYCLKCLPASLVNDRRQETEHRPMGWCIAHDKFMSGWGHARNRSFYAIAVEDDEERDIVLDNLNARSEMTNVHYAEHLPTLVNGDHLSLTDRGEAPRFFVAGGFSSETPYE